MTNRDFANLSKEELLRTTLMLQAKLDYVSYSQQFGCLTRQALDLALSDPNLDLSSSTIIFFDIDNLKAYNTQWGINESSNRLGKVLRTRVGDGLFGQYFSGDEFVLIVPSKDALGVCQRLLHDLRQIGSSATFAFAHYWEGLHITTQIDLLIAHVAQLKNNGTKGIISHVSR